MFTIVKGYMDGLVAGVGELKSGEIMWFICNGFFSTLHPLHILYHPLLTAVVKFYDFVKNSFSMILSTE